ncbi:hypothetical protein I3760_16G056000 [Carya illinoinensis]|uniref:Uncharacterized protein n=1 Tax=Carya illinoinensis TaxID=32201 RepID=A0A922D104_CARIL|nr:hypothetical protein I3760_16G056000 [Carya illinoinensis]KAG2663951.1 hypothetical protein I3760_16G056000 [Carya illinoinensis]KAG6672356.1 hypothetical protein I3842_16G053300 [Carya illinoinensis]KAG6672357.1 hypothetical protein I3842_16G053300 [Carya illinoinensis]
MGKKSRKTKALSIAIAESSSTGDIDQSQQQAQPQTPRKRGRPRKIVERPDIQDQKEEQLVSDEAQVAARENQSKKVKMGREEQQEQQHVQHQPEQQKLKGEGSSASMRGIKKEGNESEKMEVPSESSLRSRARRKSKPRKSS